MYKGGHKMEMKANVVLDAKGLACPMPIVKTKKEMTSLTPGDVLEVQATDQGSTADLKAWAESAGHQYLGTIEEANVLKHYVRKTSGDDKVETKHPHVTSNDQLTEMLAANELATLIDVRESIEYAFDHIPEAINIPLGELQARANELDKNQEVYLICRTGNRSDVAARQLAALGFERVYNVVPGMHKWTGKTTGAQR